MCHKATIYIDELLLTLFSPFDIKCKKLNSTNLWKCIFKASRRVSFLYFPKVSLDHWGCPDTFKNFWGPYYNIQFKPYETLRWKIGNSCACIVNFEHISHFILQLSLLNLIK